MIKKTIEENNINAETMHLLEQIECSYWMKYYKGNAILSTYKSSIGDGFMCAIPSVDILGMNRVMGLGTTHSIDQSILDQIINFYKVAGSPRFFVQLSPTQKNEAIKNLLEENGFVPHNYWTKLYREVNPVKSVNDFGLEIKKIDVSEKELYGQLIYKSFDWEEGRLISWLASTVGAEGYQHYIVFKEGIPIAGGALYIEGEMASMAFAGTLEQYRGLGAQRLLLETRLNDAYKQGAKLITSETAKQTEENEVVSFKNMLKHGFKIAYYRQNWLYKF